jgi:hypothetical protein
MQVTRMMMALGLLLVLASCSSCAGEDTIGSASLAGTTACQTCANVTPQDSVILVHGRNDSSSRWDTLVSNWSSRGYTENVNLFHINLLTYCGDRDFCEELPAYAATSDLRERDIRKMPQDLHR